MIAVCPGSFDPITFGHLDVISRAAKLFDEVIVAVGINSQKNYLFDVTERVELVTSVTEHLNNVSVAKLEGLLTMFCMEVSADVLVKGLRFASDFDFELQMAQINAELTGIETLLLPATSAWGTLSATMVREVALFSGDVSAFVPKVVAERIQTKHLQKYSN